MASDFKTKHIIEFLLKEAKESLDHERLKKDLAAWANSKGFVRIVPGFSDGTIPDVLRTDNAKHVFVGDAKNADNETQDNPATLQRLQNYFEQFAACLRQGYKGGFFAIATNSESEAKKWISALNFLAKAAGLTAGALKRPPRFRVVKLVGKKTWIIYW